MLNIILTIDYEIFGEGTGDVMQHMVNPTAKILGILNRHQVPITIMFEVCEYLKFVEYDKQLKKDWGYSFADKIREQVVAAYQDGHDIQLHIHPQWLDAGYANKHWLISNPYRSIVELSAKQINAAISSGKKAIEKLIKPFDPEYTCCAMRLTNLPWVEAPAEVLPAMKNNSIKVHSLAVADNPHDTSTGYWYLDKDKQLIEIPIHSIEAPRYKALTFHRLKTALYRTKYTSELTKILNKLKGNKKSTHSLTRPYSLKWDFCKQSAKEMLSFLEKGMARYDYTSREIPLVMISHSKDFFNEKNLNSFLDSVINKYHKLPIRFTTMGNFIREVLL